MAGESGQTEARIAREAHALALEEAGVAKGYGSSSRTDAASHAERKSALGLGLLGAVLIVLLVCGLWAASGIYAHAAHEQGAITLRESILQAADQCYAIEGAYPVSLRYLESRYGLSVNQDGYDVVYEVFASNIAPTVVVKAL